MDGVQFVYSISWNFEEVLEAVRASKYTDRISYAPRDGEPEYWAGKFSYTVKGVQDVRVQVASGSTVQVFIKRARMPAHELTVLIRALADVYWLRSGNLDNLQLRRVVPLRRWLDEVFYSTPEGEYVRGLPDRLRRQAEENAAHGWG